MVKLLPELWYLPANAEAKNMSQNVRPFSKRRLRATIFKSTETAHLISSPKKQKNIKCAVSVELPPKDHMRNRPN